MNDRLYVLGIDGGGTRSRALLADLNESTLAQHESGASNPNVVGFDTAADNLAQAIRECCTQAACDLSRLGVIVLGLAGMGRQADRETLRQAVALRLFDSESQAMPIIVESDARIALEGAFSGNPGIILIGGTGSIVMGKTHRGEILRVGGWGRLLGDEGSGFSIGREALVSVTHDIDNRSYAGGLRKLLSQRLHWNSRDDIVEAVYRDNFDLASLAPIVMEAAQANDLVAQKILDQAANLLVEQCSALVRQMGVSVKMGLVLFGGLVQEDTIYAKTVQMKLLKTLPQVEVRPPLRSAVEGAVIMGIQKLKGRSPIPQHDISG